MCVISSVLIFALCLVGAEPPQNDSERYVQASLIIAQCKEEITRINKTLKDDRFSHQSVARQELEDEREVFRKTFREESLKGAKALKTWIEDNPSPVKSIKTLKRWHLIGVLFAGAQSCKDALVYFDKCQNHDLFPSFRINDVLVSKEVEGLVSHCNKIIDGVEEDPQNGESEYSYSGKTIYTLNLLLQKDGKRLIDTRPYLSYEIERLSRRIFSRDELAQAEEAFRKLSPNGSVLVEPPFILVGGPGRFAGRILPERIGPGGGEHTSARDDVNSLKLVYSGIVQPTEERLNEEYFDKEPQNLIPIFLVGGNMNTEGLRGFSRYCEEVHLRSCGLRIGYHFSYDNSIMVWLATGGGTLNHELVHVLMEADFPSAPGWLAEGMASLNEELGKRNEPNDNYRLLYTKEALDRFRRLIPLETLIALQRSDFERGPLVRLHGAFARYFCMYLLKKHAVLPKVYKDIRALPLKSVSAQTAVLEKHLRPLRINDIQRKWEAWVKNQQVPSKWASLKNEIHDEVEQLQDIPWAR
ncbi:MAG: hypothetical protein ACYSYL_10480 [Planctomycetota bacterium]|jgi:hypothetical protein